MVKKKIVGLLDMDGVMFDFVGAANKIHGVEFDWTKWNGWKSHLQNEEDFWRPINEAGESFWESIELYPWANNLLETMQTFCEEVYFCTTPALEPCSSAKVRSILRHFPKMGRNFIITPHKHLLAKPNVVLVDDNEDNCRKFARDGRTILFPQPWNDGRVMLKREQFDRAEYVAFGLSMLIKS